MLWFCLCSVLTNAVFCFVQIRHINAQYIKFKGRLLNDIIILTKKENYYLLVLVTIIKKKVEF